MLFLSCLKTILSNYFIYIEVLYLLAIDRCVACIKKISYVIIRFLSIS